ncbi:flagellar hook-length control protein FliK [Campylobacter upsaliensis]|uniref:flagellar hook-length control protein FliK n=1 Tax=Campylobacter upsaliensis TaxID=28080 RepID=UPI002B39E859|nr:flagellar hook-length control protein FliK [Campylobacter upsaliensis]MEB2810695.1 flagellar hook-length control protein FliK [Campylobacter upsaliensis]
MSNLSPQSEILNLAPSKTSQASFSKTIKNNPKEEKAGENERESFLNSLLASIEETNEHLPTHMKISESEIVGEVMQKLQIGNFDEGDKISVFESAPLMQILSVLDKLKTDLSNVKLANLANNNTLLQLIKNENNFNALKNANSLGELLNLAKDMGLEVRDIKVDRLLDLKATFPNLDKKDFFKGAIDNVFKEVLNHKLAHIEKNLDTNLHTQNKTPIKTNEANSLLSKTLQNLDSLIKKEDKTRQLDQGKKESDEETELKTPIKTNKNEILKENLKDVKLNHLSEGLKITSENLTKVVQNKTSENLFSELLNKETNKELFTKENGENTANTEKSGIDDLNNLVKDLSRVNQNQKIISPKETLQYFSKDLKEAMEQYKAPITKLSITLNPSNLGEVEVTLVQRGANLHINFNSNHNAMNLFLQHQAEFKNSLVNMGFTGLEMNFSDQGKKEQQQEKKSKSHYYEENFEEESGPKINLELVLAKYF